MQNRFKFRIPMFTDKGTFQEFEYVEFGDEIECTLCGSNGEPQQCTGLKDKNGKLIYEGDIVTVRRNHLGEHFVGKNYVVRFYRYQYWLHNCGYHPLENFSYRANQNLEVIGNIYENPELLDK